MRTIGIDLAVDASNTAAVGVAWDRGGAQVLDLRTRCTDDDVVELLSGLRSGERAGVDCPFGWPRAFTDAVAAHAHLRQWPGRGSGMAFYRKEMRLRLTDRRVYEETGKLPLSVAFDRLGAMAARWAQLADEVEARTGSPIDRSGAGQIAEVYPAAACVRWGIVAPPSIDAVLRAAPWLSCADADHDLCTRNRHCLDALLAALVARALAVGRCDDVPAEDYMAAEVEGWIRMPRKGSGLADLASA
ncbi:MAG: DUF429 domain-containing protein [Streptomycetaceae bacterium]|nr:DUF429 domain-containing protein [Streptomycetaceae bacterium]